MADTVRTRAAVLALLADNSSGDISAQDVRDAVVSMFGVYGAIYVADGSTAQTGVTTTPEILTAWAANGLAVDMTADQANNQITVGTDGVYLIGCQVAFESGGVAQWEFHLRIDGAEQWPGTHRRVTTTDVGSCSFFAIMSLTASQALTVYVESDNGSGEDLTVRDAQLIALRVA
jgi:hypothetical protein